MRRGHALCFGQVVPRIGGLLSDPAAYRYLPLGGLPARLLGWWPCWPARLRRRLPLLLSGGITQLLVATRDGG